MKKYLSQGKPPRWIVYMTIFFLLFMGGMCKYAWAGMIDYPKVIHGDGLDTVKFYIWQDWVLQDSTSDSLKFALDTLPNNTLTTTLELDNTKDYTITTLYFWNGESKWISDDEYLGFSTYSGVPVNAYTTKFYAIDSSGTDQAINNVGIIAQNLSGVYQTSGRTLSDGSWQTSLDSGSYIIIARLSPTYIFPIDTVLVDANDDSIAIKGYNQTIDTSSTPALATIYGYIYDISGSPIEYAEVTAMRVDGDNATDTASGVAFSNIIISDETNDVGYFSFSLTRTGQYTDTTQGFYKITCTHNESDIFIIPRLHVPSTGNVNIVDELVE